MKKLLFDAIYVLTCRNLRGRLPRVQEQLRHYKFDIQYPIHILFSPTSKLIDMFFTENCVLSDWAHSNKYTIYCTFGHYLIYHDMLDRGYGSALILEDDVRLHNDTSVFTHSISNVPADSDIAMLDWWPYIYGPYFKSGRFSSYMKARSDQAWIPFDTDQSFAVRSTGAYIVSRKGASALIDTHDSYAPSRGMKRNFIPADDALNEVVRFDKSIVRYIANPILARQASNSKGSGGFDGLYRKDCITSPGLDFKNYEWDFSSIE